MYLCISTCTFVYPLFSLSLKENNFSFKECFIVILYIFVPFILLGLIFTNHRVTPNTDTQVILYGMAIIFGPTEIKSLSLVQWLFFLFNSMCCMINSPCGHVWPSVDYFLRTIRCAFLIIKF